MLQMLMASHAYDDAAIMGLLIVEEITEAVASDQLALFRRWFTAFDAARTARRGTQLRYYGPNATKGHFLERTQGPFNCMSGLKIPTSVSGCDVNQVGSSAC